MLILGILQLLLFITTAGRVRPYGSRALTMSNVNPNSWSDYNFTLTLDTTLPDTGKLYIVFPQTNYPEMLGLRDTYDVYCPYPRKLVVGSEVSVSGRTVTINLGYWPPEVPLTVTISNVINSQKSGGTGNFEIYTMIDTYVVDSNKNFAVIGLADSTQQLINATMSLSNSYAGETTDYTAIFVPSQNLGLQIEYIIEFPLLYNLLYFTDCQSNLFPAICKVHSNFNNQILIQGSNATVQKGTQVIFTLKNIINPNRMMKTPLFKFRIIELNTNNTLQESQAVNGLTIQAGLMKLVSLTPLYYRPYVSYIRDFSLKFRPKNAFQYGRIVTDFYQVLSCSITRGLLDLSQSQDSICTTLGRMMYISNFQSYVESDYSYEYVEIQFTARIADQSILTNPVEIYTYQDKEYITLADQDTESIASQVFIYPKPNLAPGTISITAFTTSTIITITLTLSINVDIVNPSIAVEVPTSFTGVPTCQYNNKGGSLFTLPCTYSNGFVNATTSLLEGVSCTPTCPKLVINNLKSPSLGGAYPIRGLIFSATTGYTFNTTITITTPQFGSGTQVSQVSNHQGQKTMINFNLKIDKSTPAGVKTLLDPYVSFSLIEVILYQQNLAADIFVADLGSGIADSKDLGCAFQDVTAASGANLSCFILHGVTPATSTSYVTVKIFGYAAIASSGQFISFKIPVTYPSTISAIPKVQVNLIRYDSKLKGIMSSQSFNLGAVKSLPGNALSVFSGPTLENPKLQVETTLKYQMKTVYSIAVGQLNGIYYVIPTGFTFNSSKVLVSIDGNYINSKNIQYFTSFLFIMFENNFSNGVVHSLIFERVDVPDSLPSSSIVTDIKTTLSGQFADTATFTVPTLTAGQLYDLSATTDTDLQYHPYANYSIAFTTSMAKGSSITIDFQAAYNLLNCYPILDNIPYSNLQNESSTKTIKYTYTATQFVITQFAPLTVGQRVSLGLFSIRNPSTGSYNLIIKINDASGKVIQQSTATITIGSSSFNLQSIDVKSADSLPNNANSLATYIYKWNLAFTLPKLATIIIKYPASFTSLYSSGITQVLCRITDSTGIVNLRKCYVDEPNNQVIQQLDLSIHTGEVIIEYQGLISQSNSFSGIIFTVQYNSITIAQGITSTITINPALSNVNAPLEFYPKNEGEKAYYKFLLPLSQFTILSTYQILIRFPVEYDYIIGIEKLQITSTILQGALKATYMPRHILIYGFYDLKNYTGNLDITILGVINPNRINNQQTGMFGFGILDGYKLLVGNMTITGIIPQLAPQGISLNSLISSTYISRYYSTFSIQFTPSQTIPATVYGGQVYVDFPEEFVIDSFTGACQTDQSFSFFASCQWDYFRFLFVTNNQNWDQSLSLTIENVRTPDEAGETKNFIIYNYDSTSKTVICRTYSNLNIASLTFQYDGIQIDVNYKQIYDLEVGSYSDLIPINVTEPLTQTLTLSPNVLDSNIIITPNPIQFNAGETITYFRLAAPRTILMKQYYITWSKTGDTLPVTYAPLAMTIIQMVKGTIKRKLIVEQMEYMPKNGTSYPLYITTNNPPYQQLLIRLSFYANLTRQKHYITDEKLAYLNVTYIQLIENAIPLEDIAIANLSSTQLEMLKLQYNTSYTLNTSYSYNLSNIVVYLKVTGYDADSFELDTTTLTIPIREQEYRKPKVLEVNTLSVTRSTATFQVFGDIKGFIYFVYADQHMPEPTFNGTQFPINNATLANSYPSYGIDYIRSSDLNVNFTIYNLKQNHDYEIFIFIVNLNQISNPQFKKVYFKTMAPQLIALMTLKVNQASIDNEVKLDYIQKMAEMLTISKSRIIERTTKCKQTSLDVASTTSYIYWNLMILPDPTNMNEYTKPLVLAQNLNSRRAEIIKFITRLDEEPFFTLQEIAENIPNFVIGPEMIDRTISSISLRFKVSYCGRAYLSIRQRENSSSLSIINETIYAQEITSIQFPSAYQIKQGLNESNQVMNQTSITIEDTQSYYQINYTDLPQKTVYDVFISLENDFVQNQLLFSNSSVPRFTAKTMKIIVPLNIYSINNAVIVQLIIMIILLMN